MIQTRRKKKEAIFSKLKIMPKLTPAEVAIIAKEKDPKRLHLENVSGGAPGLELLQAFAFQGEDVRIYGTPENPLWVTMDVARILDIKNVLENIRSFDETEKCVLSITDSIGRSQETSLVTEIGLYRLIFTSRKPQAKIFRAWVFGTVLPSIRKTGHYGASESERRLTMEERELDARLSKEEKDLDARLEKQRVELEKQRLELAERKKAFSIHITKEYWELMERLGGVDERDKMQMRDMLRTDVVSSSRLAIEDNRDDEELTLTGAWQELSQKTLSRGKQCGLGKEIKKAYFQEFGHYPPKRMQYVDGAPREVCSYRRSWLLKAVSANSSRGGKT